MRNGLFSTAWRLFRRPRSADPEIRSRLWKARTQTHKGSQTHKGIFPPAAGKLTPRAPEKCAKKSKMEKNPFVCFWFCEKNNTKSNHTKGFFFLKHTKGFFDFSERRRRTHKGIFSDFLAKWGEKFNTEKIPLCVFGFVRKTILK